MKTHRRWALPRSNDGLDEPDGCAGTRRVLVPPQRSVLRSNGRSAAADLHRWATVDGARCIVLGALAAVVGCYSGRPDVAMGPDAAAEDEGDDDGDTGDGGDTGDTDGTDDTPSESDCADVGRIAPAPLRRLTRLEYDNTVRDLLGTALQPADAFPPDDKPGGFAANTTTHVATPLAEHYALAADALALDAVERIDELVGCAPDGPDECAHEFIASFASRAYRRPLAEAELDGLTQVYEIGASHAEGLSLVVQAVLQSPDFLYHVELGGAPDDLGVAALTSHELAARLSYLLWASMPDEALTSAAEDGVLDTPEGLLDEANRLLDDPRARAAIASFHVQWLQLEHLPSAQKDAATYPEFPELALAMVEESVAFADYLVRYMDGTPADMLTADYTVAGAPLAALYGAAASADMPAYPLAEGDAQVVVHPAGERAGVLTLAGVLAMHGLTNNSDPIRRGKFVRKQLLCGSLPSPPEDVPEPPPSDPNVSRAEQLEQHRVDPACNGCHLLIDTIGVGLERYDGIGRFRTELAGAPIDAAGELLGTDVDGAFVGAIELGQRLAGSAEVERCFVKQWFRYSTGRREDATPEDACHVEDLHTAFAEQGGSIRELLLAIVASESFRHVRN